jgi:hypothetical protein
MKVPRLAAYVRRGPGEALLFRVFGNVLSIGI